MGVFKKIGSAIKRFATGAYDKVKRGIQVAAPKLLQLGSAGLGILAKAPGTIGQVSAAAKAGADTLKNIVSNVPNQGVKDKLTNILDKGSGFVDKASNVANQVVNKATPIVNRGMDAANKVNEVANRM
jgi:hypothetical protein